MIDRDVQRAARIVEDHERGDLTDLTVLGALAAVRAEATVETRQRLQEKLERLAASYTLRGRPDVGVVLTQLAADLAPRDGAPTVAELADA